MSELKEYNSLTDKEMQIRSKILPKLEVMTRVLFLDSTSKHSSEGVKNLSLTIARFLEEITNELNTIVN